MLTPVVVAVGLTPRAAAEAAAAGRLKLGVLQGMFRDVPPAILEHAAKPFADLFHRQTGLNGDVEMCPDCDVLAAKMTAKELHIGVYHGFEYAWVRSKHPDLLPLVITIPPGRKVQAILVINKNDKANTPADLNGQSVVVPTYTKAHCYLFLDRLRDELPPNCCEKAKHPQMTPGEALDAVVDGTQRCVLVDIASLTAYEANKPGNFAVLKVLARSEEFPPAVIAYRKGAVGANTIGQIRTGLLTANKTAQGKAFMMLWKLQGFEDIPAGFDAQLEKINKAYPPPAVAPAAAAPAKAIPPK
jgi:ABC-type phosphate/phosphonate transport system substrate-binding protein